MRSVVLAALFLLLVASPAGAHLSRDEVEAPSAVPLVATTPATPGFEVVPAGRPRSGEGGGMVGAVPEPSAFLAFAAGALLVGTAVRRRRPLR